MSENTGRWNSRILETRGARNKRSLNQQQQQQYQPLNSPDMGGVSGGGDDDVNANDGDGRIVHDNTVNSISSLYKLNARANNNHNALPQQMYDAMLMIRRSSSSGSQTRTTTTTTHRPYRKHRKRQTGDVIVYHKDAAGRNVEDDFTNETINFVPLDSEHRIRVNLTIAADDTVGSPLYEVSLSLPGAEKLAAENQPADVAALQTAPGQLSPSAGTECECFCPCLEQDPDDPTTENAFVASLAAFTKNNISGSARMDDATSRTSDLTEATTTSELWSETTEMSCPPPVFLFCDHTGKSLADYYIQTNII